MYNKLEMAEKKLEVCLQIPCQSQGIPTLYLILSEFLI